MNKYVTSLFFLLFCRGISVFAQIGYQPIDGNQYGVYANSESFVEEEKEMLSDTIVNVGLIVKDSARVGTICIQKDGMGNTLYNINITNNVSKNKEELVRAEKELERNNAKQDSILFMQKRYEEEMREIKEILHGKMVEKDSAYQELLRRYNTLEETFALQKKWSAELDSVIQLQSKQIAELKETIQLQEKDNFLPLGIKQFRNDKKALGYTFLASEIAVPVALGIGLERAARQNYKKHKAQEAQTLGDHRDYYKKYKNHHRAAIWAPVVAEVLVYGANVLCNYYCPIDIKKQDIALRPTVGVDCRGKVLCGIGMTFNF